MVCRTHDNCVQGNGEGGVLLIKECEGPWQQIGYYETTSSDIFSRYFIFDLSHPNIIVRKPFGEFETLNDNYIRTNVEGEDSVFQTIEYAVLKHINLFKKCCERCVQ